VSEDPQGNGLPWARNRGMERATGEVLFFCDADDTVESGFFSRPLEEIERTGADFCIFQYARSPLKRDYSLEGNARIREVFLPAFMGLSFDDARRWNAGGSLFEKRESGSVCRFACRLDLLRRNAVRFNEKLRIFEDASFICEVALHAEKAACIRESLYDYSVNPNGITATVMNTRRHWDYKFAILEERKRLAEAGGEGVWRYCEASCVFSALEMLALWKKAGLTLREFRRGMAEYLRDPVVGDALGGFPLSPRHPVAAAAVAALRLWRAAL
jgi:glycosyltransferase involved in cell wall biosynthesis